MLNGKLGKLVGIRVEREEVYYVRSKTVLWNNPFTLPEIFLACIHLRFNSRMDGGSLKGKALL